MLARKLAKSKSMVTRGRNIPLLILHLHHPPIHLSPRAVNKLEEPLRIMILKVQSVWFMKPNQLLLQKDKEQKIR